MKLHFGFSNSTPPVNFSASMLQATPLELVIAADASPHSRKKALSAYLLTLDYMFRGVTNSASSYINSVSVEKDWFGKMEKHNDVVNWTAVVDKSFVVVYGIELQQITENMYVADAIKVGAKRSENVDPVWIQELINPTTKPDQTVREHIMHAVSVVTKYVEGYRLVYGFDGGSGLSIVREDNVSIKVEDISDDETFVILRLLVLLLSKGTHMGVFMLNCEGFSEKAIQAIVDIAKLFFGDAYIFMYNCRDNIKVDRLKVTLPNFLVTG
jgi:hypothetical protein